jgi:SAM-dependent methyltransferase
LWTERSGLQHVQYRTDARLAARQSIYAFQRPPVNLPSQVLSLAGLHGDETVADVGCGNGLYLAELTRRGHAGRVLGIDLSTGMLAAARSRAPGAGLVAADAAALPLRDNASGLTMANHMLYHVPDPQAAVRELRRITRPAGQVLVTLNGDDHLRELRQLVVAAARELTGAEPPSLEPLSLDDGQYLLASEFSSVTRHDFISELVIGDPQLVEDYARSMITIQHLPDPEALAAAVGDRVRTSGQAEFLVRAHSGCLICS